MELDTDIPIGSLTVLFIIKAALGFTASTKQKIAFF